MPCDSPINIVGRMRSSLSHPQDPSSPEVAAAIAQCGRSGPCDGHAGSYICIAWQSIIAAGINPRCSHRDEAAYNPKLAVSWSGLLHHNPGVWGSSVIEIVTQPQFSAVSLGSQAQDDIGFIVAAASKHMPEFIVS